MRAAVLLLAVLAARAQSPLEVVGGLDGMVDRYLSGVAERQFAARKAAVARIRTAADVRVRQEYVRGKLLAEIGGLPARTPLNARITGTVERAGYRIEKLVFESQPRFYVTANVYVPAGGKPPYPAVLGTAGHSLDGKADDTYQHAWISLAKRGFVVLAYDPPGQGERFEYLDTATGRSALSGGGTGEHIMAGLQCLLTGTNIARYFINDGMRALDYLLTRPDVDAKRIAVAGNSGGGTQSSYLAAFEPRLAAAAPSCYLTAWETLWADPGPQDAEQVFAGFLRDGLDFPDFLISFAPRPIQMATAVRDFFPIDGARATYAEARATFRTLGAADHMGYFEFDDTHGWSKPRREATYRWLARWLEERNDDGVEDPDVKTSAPKELAVTDTGQVSTAFPGAATVQSLNLALAEELYAKRAGEVAAKVRTRLNVATERGAPPFEKRGEIARESYRIEMIALRPETGITVPALVFVPSGGAARKPAVLSLNSSGKAADAGALEGLARAGNVVLAIDPRGWGEAGSAPGPRGGYSKAYQTNMRALLVGMTMAGMQTGDTLRAFDYLNSRPDVDARRIRAIGKGKGCAIALFAGVLEPRITQVECEEPPPSYMEVVRARMHSGDMDLVVPGVLRDFDLPDVGAALGARFTSPNAWPQTSGTAPNRKN